MEETLLDIREALGLRQSEMADKLGLNQSSISRMECGKIPTDKRTLLAAKALLAERKAKKRG